MNHDDSVWSDGDESVASRHSASQVGSGASVASRGSAGSGSDSDAGSGRARPAGRLMDQFGADMQCCTFRIGDQLFGLDVDAVGEVFQIERIVKVPLAPPGVLGLTNLRGAAIAVVDLAAVLGLTVDREQRAIDGTGPALVLRLQGIRAAASIDRVESVFPVHSDSIRESAALAEHPAIAGFLPLADEVVASILDIEELTERMHRLRLRRDGDVGGTEGLGDEA